MLHLDVQYMESFPTLSLIVLVPITICSEFPRNAFLETHFAIVAMDFSTLHLDLVPK